MRSEIVWNCQTILETHILVEAAPLILMDRFRQCSLDKPESGGILLGYRRGDHLHVTLATPPQADDFGWRYFFKRSARHHQEIALRQWYNSDKKMDYLGEWHTHPQSVPIPSSLDFSEWQKISNRRPVPMVFIIAGWDGNIWLGLSSQGKIVPCTPA